VTIDDTEFEFSSKENSWNVAKNSQNQTAMQAYKTDPWNHVFIFLLYFFEWVTITSFFDRLAQLRGSFESDIFLERNFYTVCTFLYQFGVLIGRSNLYCFKTKATGLITAVMLVLTLILFYFCLFYVDVDRFVVFFLALLVGLFGGWGYVYSYYRVMDNNKVTRENKEILINYLAI
jgi:hypothetical protein